MKFEFQHGSKLTSENLTKTNRRKRSRLRVCEQCFLRLGSVSVRGIGSDSELGFSGSVFGPGTRTEPKPNRDQISRFFLRNYRNYSKKPNSPASVRGIGSDSELGFFRFGFRTRNSDRTETEPGPRSSFFLGINLLRAIRRPLIRIIFLYRVLEGHGFKNNLF